MLQNKRKDEKKQQPNVDKETMHQRITKQLALKIKNKDKEIGNLFTCPPKVSLAV